MLAVLALGLHFCKRVVQLLICVGDLAAERSYSVGEQELLTVVDAMRTWRCYLEGVTADMFTVVTDHNPLTYLQSQSVLSRKETLQMFTFKWLYRPGKSNVADPLSTNPGVVAALLPVAVAESLCRCVSELSPKVMAYCCCCDT